ncbi:MAG: HIT family protein [Candidatus Aegiribacteria sp.]|nr:HIT family protein [Candidatus Aegiribacteria sp.]
MSTWTDLSKWQKFLTQDGCPICNQTPDSRPPTERTIVSLSISRLVADRNTCLKGHCCLVSRPHAVELHDLSDEDSAAFMRDLRVASSALMKATDAIKLNYEIHGNTIPHLHMHLWPRHPGDRFDGEPIDWRTKTTDTYEDGEFESFVETMKETLGIVEQGADGDAATSAP